MDYDDILNATWEEIPEPELLPDGRWLARGTTVGFVKPRDENGFAKVLFTYKAKEPVNVAEDLLEELGDYDVTTNDLQFQIIINSPSDWAKVKKHLALHGVELDPKARLFNDAGKLAFAKAFAGSEVIVTIGQRSYENQAGETVWQNSLSGFAAVEE